MLVDSSWHPSIRNELLRVRVDSGVVERLQKWCQPEAKIAMNDILRSRNSDWRTGLMHQSRSKARARDDIH